MTKVTEEGIKAKISKVEYFQLPDSTVTICSITLQNGFSVRGESACVDPAIFNKETGERFAYEDAFSKLWQLEGYLLAEQLYQSRLNINVHPKTPVPGSFGFALQALNEYKRVARAGWNGANQWICKSGEDGGTLVPSAKFWAPQNQAFAEGNGGVARVMPCITLKNAQDQIVMGWAPSQSDMLATDWYILPPMAE